MIQVCVYSRSGDRGAAIKVQPSPSAISSLALACFATQTRTSARDPVVSARGVRSELAEGGTSAPLGRRGGFWRDFLVHLNTLTSRHTWETETSKKKFTLRERVWYNGHEIAFATGKLNCRQSGSNRRPLDYETNATTNCAIAATTSVPKGAISDCPAHT